MVRARDKFTGSHATAHLMKERLRLRVSSGRKGFKETVAAASDARTQIQAKRE
jgi:hypothetical protein